MGFSSFMLGLATAFLVCAAVSFAMHGLFGLYYLIAGGASAGASVAAALIDSRRAGKATAATPLRS
jgi:hypothetical protein